MTCTCDAQGECCVCAGHCECYDAGRQCCLCGDQIATQASGAWQPGRISLGAETAGRLWLEGMPLRGASAVLEYAYGCALLVAENDARVRAGIPSIFG